MHYCVAPENRKKGQSSCRFPASKPMKIGLVYGSVDGSRAPRDAGRLPMVPRARRTVWPGRRLVPKIVPPAPPGEHAEQTGAFATSTRGAAGRVNDVSIACHENTGHAAS